MAFKEKISKEAKTKLHTYIKACLKEDITEKLNAVTEESIAGIKEKEKQIAEKAAQEAKAREAKLQEAQEKSTGRGNNENVQDAEDVEELDEE